MESEHVEAVALLRLTEPRSASRPVRWWWCQIAPASRRENVATKIPAASAMEATAWQGGVFTPLEPYRRPKPIETGLFSFSSRTRSVKRET